MDEIAQLLSRFEVGENFINFTHAHKDNVQAVAIGNFDGFHKGHEKLFENLGANGAIILVVAHLSAKLTPLKFAQNLTTLPIFFCDLRIVKNLNGAEFIALLEQNFKSLNKIVVGRDFHFGKDRAADTEFLKRNFSGETKVVDEFCIGGVGVHTSTIKAFLANGECEKAAQFLGREYTVRGRVVRGQGLGAKELVATINLDFGDFFTPRHGVYATYTRVDEMAYKSISFLGHRVSTDGVFALESHILGDFDGEIPEFVEVSFVKFLRKNQKFQSLAKLKNQILSDINTVRTVLDNQIFTQKGLK